MSRIQLFRITASRHFLPACLVFGCLVLFGLRLGHAAKEFKWSSSFPTPNVGSSQNSKPLLVIDLAGDVTAEPFTSPMGRILAATTFSDPRIIELSRKRFDVVCRQHGATPFVKRSAPKRKKDKPDNGHADNVIFYFCTPDARVLHLATGFLPADSLLRAAELSERLLRESQLNRDSDFQLQAVQAWHVTCADAKHLASFRQLCAEKRDRRKTEGAFDVVRRIVSVAATVHLQELRVRFAGQWQGAVLEEAITKMAHHGEIATSFSHLVLSELPLVPLDKLDRSCFEVVTGQPFLAITARRKALYSWFLAARRQRQAIMLLVDDKPFEAPLINELSELLIWQPKSSAVGERLKALAAVQITPGELAGLIQDAALESITLSQHPQNWLLFDRNGDFVDLVFKENGTHLSEAIELATR